jgi:hypothetical protein
MNAALDINIRGARDESNLKRETLVNRAVSVASS